MTQDEIIELAKQSDLGFLLGDSWLMHHEIEYFAKLIAEKEREACAQLCIDEVWASSVSGTSVQAFNYASKECANRIRARGQA